MTHCDAPMMEDGGDTKRDEINETSAGRHPAQPGRDGAAPGTETETQVRDGRNTRTALKDDTGQNGDSERKLQ